MTHLWGHTQIPKFTDPRDNGPEMASPGPLDSPEVFSPSLGLPPKIH